MHQAIDQRGDACGIGEHLGPFREGPIGGYDGALFFIALIEKLEQKIGMAGAIGQVACYRRVKIDPGSIFS